MLRILFNTDNQNTARLLAVHAHSRCIICNETNPIYYARVALVSASHSRDPGGQLILYVYTYWRNLALPRLNACGHHYPFTATYIHGGETLPLNIANTCKASHKRPVQIYSDGDIKANELHPSVVFPTRYCVAITVLSSFSFLEACFGFLATSFCTSTRKSAEVVSSSLIETVCRPKEVMGSASSMQSSGTCSSRCLRRAIEMSCSKTAHLSLLVGSRWITKSLRERKSAKKSVP